MIKDEDIIFNKVNDYLFQAELSPRILEYVDNIVKDISTGLVDKYDINMNMYLEDRILSRLISSCYMRKFTFNVPDTGFVKIIASLGERDISVSCGLLDEGEEKIILDGVIY